MTTTQETGALLLGYASPPTLARTIGFSTAPVDVPAPPFELPVLQPLGSGPVIVFGRTGSGKTRHCLISAVLRAPADQTLVIIDVKREISSVTAEYRRRLGSKVFIIDPWNETGSPDCLNPIDLIDPTSPSAADDAATLADALVVESHRGDRFWDSASKNAIAAGLLLLATHAEPELRNLGALADALGAGAGPTLAGFLAAGICSNAAGGIIRRECENLAGLAPQTLSSIGATLSTHLRPLSSPLIKTSFSYSSFSLDDFSRGEPMSIYLCVPADRVGGTHRSIVRAWLNTLITAAARRRERPRSRTLFLVDEAPALGKLEAVKTASYLLRSYGVDLLVCAQAVDQLTAIYDDAQALLDNAAAIISLSGGGPLRRLVRMTIGDEAASSMGDLPPGQAALIRNDRLEFIKKADYLSDPAFRDLGQLNRFYHGAAENVR